MKNLITAIALTITTTAPLSAEKAVSEETKEHCAPLESLATTIMETRQSGESILTAMDIGDTAFAKGLVLVAYQSPHYSTDEYQRKAVTTFRNTVVLTCYEARTTP